jgi:hypothetical protein
MKKYLFLTIFFVSSIIFGQTDYSSSWEDFYSYNNVKDFVIVDELIYALTDNAIFTYNLATTETQKLSSVQGLSGQTTSAIFYNEAYKKVVIGYQNGLIEVIDENGRITVSPDIVNFNQSGAKSINHIAGATNKLYVSTPFAIVVYDIEKLEFGDTYFIGNNSTAIEIHQTVILNNQIYAATENGIFSADLSSPNLIDFNNWQQSFSGNFSQISRFENTVYAAQNASLFRVNETTRTLIRNFGQPIVCLKTSEATMSVALKNSVFVFDRSLNQLFTHSANTTFNYTLNTAFSIDGKVYLGTNEFGILASVISENPDFLEIHPDGPLSNEVFSINAKNSNLWVVYGGYSGVFGPLGNKKGYSHFNGETWINTPYNPDFPITDMVDITFDPENDQKVYISSFGDTRQINSVSTGGILVVEDDAPAVFYNHLNSGLENISAIDPTRVNIRISGTAFDTQGNLWVSNIEVDKKLKKKTPNGQWTGFDLSTIESNPGKPGVYELIVDRSNSIWMGTRANGVYIFNENGNRKKALVTNITQGGLPDLKVKTIEVDASNRIWIGTSSGLVVYSNAASVFDAQNVDAAPIIILDDGIPKRLLGDQTINSIEVDGADNKWFGTENGGVVYTNPNGQTTLANFGTQNSPLPSNKIVKIRVDTSTGKVFFATDKGIVAYNSNVSPFGESLGDVYAYPNPALKNHETVTIDGRNGTHLPKGTNVKILDVSGNLVHETNVVEGQELQGGKVVWDKTNLAGRKVASGVYIILLINKDGSESTTAKIAIVN